MLTVNLSSSSNILSSIDEETEVLGGKGSRTPRAHAAQNQISAPCHDLTLSELTALTCAARTCMSMMVVYKSVSPSLLSSGTGGEEWSGAENVPIAAPSLGKDPRRS